MQTWTSTGDVAIDKARMRVVNRDADNIIDRCWNMRQYQISWPIIYVVTNVNTSGKLC